MIDVRKLGHGIRRRLGAPSNHLEMAGNRTTLSVGQAKSAVKNPSTEAPTSLQFRDKPRTKNAANMRASVRDQW